MRRIRITRPDMQQTNTVMDGVVIRNAGHVLAACTFAVVSLGACAYHPPVPNNGPDTTAAAAPTSPTAAFCAAVEVQISQASSNADLAAKYQHIADVAPPEVAADAHIVADEMRPAGTSHPTHSTAETEAATTRVNNAYEHHCRA